MNKPTLSFVAVVLYLGLADAQNFPVTPLTPVGDGKAYFFQTFFKANFFEALRFCRYVGMELATLPTEADVLRVNKYLQAQGLENERFWTSGNDLGESKKWVWFGNGREFQSAAIWNAGEPNSSTSTEHCVEIRKLNGVMKLNDIGCTDSIYFICESVSDV